MKNIFLVEKKFLFRPSAPLLVEVGDEEHKNHGWADCNNVALNETSLDNKR